MKLGISGASDRRVTSIATTPLSRAPESSVRSSPQ